MGDSPFTNPSNAAARDAGGYVDAVLALIGDRDPAEVLAELADALDRISADVDTKELRQPEADGKWSMMEILAHLADSELLIEGLIKAGLAE